MSESDRLLATTASERSASIMPRRRRGAAVQLTAEHPTRRRRWGAADGAASKGGGGRRRRVRGKEWPAAPRRLGRDAATARRQKGRLGRRRVRVAAGWFGAVGTAGCVYGGSVLVWRSGLKDRKWRHTRCLTVCGGGARKVRSALCVCRATPDKCASRAQTARPDPCIERRRWMRVDRADDVRLDLCPSFR